MSKSVNMSILAALKCLRYIQQVISNLDIKRILQIFMVKTRDMYIMVFQQFFAPFHHLSIKQVHETSEVIKFDHIQ